MNFVNNSEQSKVERSKGSNNILFRGVSYLMAGYSSHRLCFFYFFLLSLFLVLVSNGDAADGLGPNQSIKDGQSLISAGGNFELRFSILSDSLRSDNRYVGIWRRSYSRSNPVWVANREDPLYDESGVLTLRTDGNLVLLDSFNATLWDTNTSTMLHSRPRLVLLDTGNLVLRNGHLNQSDIVMWQSFDHPTDTLLPGMKIGINLKTNRTQMLLSWSGRYDPSPGIFSFGIDPQAQNQFFIWMGRVPYCRSLFLNGNKAYVLPFDEVKQSYLNFTVVANEKEVYISYDDVNISPDDYFYNRYLSLSPNGELVVKDYDIEAAQAAPFGRKCNDVDACGSFSSCNENNRPKCKCLPGFQRQSHSGGNWTYGCVRKKPLNCEGDKFFPLPRIKVVPPGYGMTTAGEAECREGCLRDCDCFAFASIGIDKFFPLSCITYKKELRGIEEMDEDLEEAMTMTLYVRVSASELDQKVERQCPNCGTNIIPYPLSTELGCGDPAFSRIYCNNNTGQLRFKSLDNSTYRITSINEESRTFVIQTERLCWPTYSKVKKSNLEINQPFHISKNNTVLPLNCSNPSLLSSLNCSFSRVCHKYMQEGGAPCFSSQRCCSYGVGDSSLTTHAISLSTPQCEAFASFVSVNVSLLIEEWWEGVEIGWEAPQEPLCDSFVDCLILPNSKCLTHTATDGRKRCICNKKFKWDSLQLKCLPARKHMDRKRNKWRLPLILVAIVLLLLGTCIIYYGRKMVSKSGRRRSKGIDFLHGTKLEDGNKELEITNFRYKTIVSATENFLNSNKLGQGGFGPVYKGKLPEGREIAVKRLSKSSGQGLEEFKNEVILIAKLQHRNLVRLLGYCLEEDEKMLVYEYMANSSLDYHLFDTNQCKLLDWKRRFIIILGISRGLLYLHHDSRLRIIHRDLKTSNILLDEEMIPKISDFGLARIFGGNQTQENTNRVIGTYGYMSPEYASHGIFSVKSDVFSFGVILIEIISGKKNTSFFHAENSLNLLGHAWDLLNENRGLDLVEPSLRECCSPHEVLKCIHVSLLCVQEDANDRPTIADVVAFFINETSTLPMPKKPAFYLRPVNHDSTSVSSISYNNEITMSTVTGR